MEELMIAVLGGIGTLLAAVLGEAIFEALGEFLGGLFGAVAEAGGEAIGAIGESGTDAGLVALGAVAAENGDSSGESGGLSGSNMYFSPALGRSSGARKKNDDEWVMPEETVMTADNASQAERPNALRDL